MWDEKYSSEAYMYGKEPNDFLKEKIDSLPPGGRILCLGDGEGRNGVYLASLGFQVTSLDASQVGLEKARRLAETKGLCIETLHADLREYEFVEGEWDGIVSIWCHLPEDLRKKVHQSAVTALRSGGAFLLEAYTPDQVGRGTGGPPVKELMMTLDSLREELSGLTTEVGQEVEREIQEGAGHRGLSASVQYIGRK